jgi:hypothetical protein
VDTAVPLGTEFSIMGGGVDGGDGGVVDGDEREEAAMAQRVFVWQKPIKKMSKG